MPLYLLLRLEAPLMSFGTVAVDARRPVQRWPAVSMLTGLLGNALGWRRTDGIALDRLQARIRWAARIDRPGVPLTDFQTAQLAHDEKGWTTRGAPEGRTGSPDTYKPPHIRQCEYRADASVAVALRLDDPDQAPTLHDLSAALSAPRRPLFIGRKNCLPALPLLAGLQGAIDTLAALDAMPLASDAVATPAVFFSDGAASDSVRTRMHISSDERRFMLDVHAGHQRVHELVRDIPAAAA